MHEHLRYDERSPLPKVASILWHASEAQRNLHECLYQKLLTLCKMNEHSALAAQEQADLDLLALFAVTLRKPFVRTFRFETFNTESTDVASHTIRTEFPQKMFS